MRLTNDATTLTITHADRIHSTNFTCEATNSFGKKKRIFKVNVVMKPYWKDFDVWSVCSVTCGKGYQERVRNCTFPDNYSGREKCEGSDKDRRACSFEPCVINGGWSQWSDWSNCSRTCGSGYQRQSRECNSPEPAHGGEYCKVENEIENLKYKYCHNDKKCPQY